MTTNVRHHGPGPVCRLLTTELPNQGVLASYVPTLRRSVRFYRTARRELRKAQAAG